MHQQRMCQASKYYTPPLHQSYWLSPSPFLPRSPSPPGSGSPPRRLKVVKRFPGAQSGGSSNVSCTSRAPCAAWETPCIFERRQAAFPPRTIYTAAADAGCPVLGRSGSADGFRFPAKPWVPRGTALAGRAAPPAAELKDVRPRPRPLTSPPVAM